MNGPYATYRRGRALIGVLLAVLVVSAIGLFAYHAGMSQGLALQVPAPGPGAYPYPYFWRPWGFGFGFFFPLLLGFLLLRLVFWGGGRRWHGGRGYHGGYCGGGYGEVPPAFDEWHRRAHRRGAEDPPAATSV
jgi:hypothetical protein